YKFSGKERDAETCGPNSTCLDYFVARDFASAFGRFLSIDPANAGSDSSNPQSWNAYAYVLNKPLNSTDPNGERPCSPEDSVCVVATPPPDILTTSILIDEKIVDDLSQVSDALQNAWDVIRRWATAPRDPHCMASAMATGSIIGTGTGGLGGAIFGGGPEDVPAVLVGAR